MEINTYKIEVYNATPEQMVEVVLAISNTGYGFDWSEDDPNRIHVHIEPFAVERVVKEIHDMGFQTADAAR